MAYPIETKLCSKNGYFTPAESNNYYATRYSREGVTVHWWGDGTGANNHDNIVNYFLAQSAAGVKSVNYVVSDIKITKMVEPDNVAWTSQAGNPTTVSIEFQPTLSAEGYKRGGWLISELEKKYGRTLSLYPHKHWASTTCPGTIDINCLRAEANNFKQGADMAEKLNLATARILAEGVLGRDRGATHAGVYDGDLNVAHVNQDLTNGYVMGLWKSAEALAAANLRNAAQGFYYTYKDVIDELSARPTRVQLDEALAKLVTESQKVTEAEAKLAEEVAKKSEDTVLLNEAGNWLTKLISRIFGKK